MSYGPAADALRRRRAAVLLKRTRVAIESSGTCVALAKGLNAAHVSTSAFGNGWSEARGTAAHICMRHAVSHSHCDARSAAHAEGDASC